ncbi:Mast/stem cell growth factor receptor [Balamuthia mandrillaris]
MPRIPRPPLLLLLLLLPLLLHVLVLPTEGSLTFVGVEPAAATPGSNVQLVWRVKDHSLTVGSFSGGGSGLRFEAASTSAAGWYCPCVNFGTWPTWPPCDLGTAGQECWYRTTVDFATAVPDATIRSSFTVPADRFQQSISVTGQLWLHTAYYDPEQLDAEATGSFTTGAAVTSIAPSVVVIGGEQSLVPGEEFVFQFRLSNSGPSNARNAQCRVRMAVEGNGGWLEEPEGTSCVADGSLKWVCSFASDISPSSSGNVQWRMTPPADFRGTLSVTVDQCSATGSQSTPPTALKNFVAAPSWSLTSSFPATEDDVMTMTEPFSFTSTLSNGGSSTSLSTTCTWSFSTAALRFDGSNADAGDCEASSSTSDNSFKVTCVRDVGGETVLHPAISVSAKEGLRGTPSFNVELGCEGEDGEALPKRQRSLMVVEELESVDVAVSVVNAKQVSEVKRQGTWVEDNLGTTKQGQFVFDDGLLFSLDFTSAGAHYARNISCWIELSGSDSVLMTFVSLSASSPGNATSASCDDFGYQPASNSRLLKCGFEDMQNEVASTREMVAKVDDRLREVGMVVNCSSTFLNSISNPVWKQTLSFIHVDAVDDDDIIPPSSSSDDSSNGSGDGGNKNENTNEDNIALPVGLALGLGLPLLLLLVALVVLFVFLRRKKQSSLRQRHKDMTSNEQASTNLYVAGDELTGTKLNSTKEKKQDKGNKKGKTQWEIPFSELEFDEQIGQGCSGTVWRGTWRETTVAIKMFNSIMDSETSKANFKAESDIMKNLRPHTNVTQLFGVSMEEGTPWCLVTEFLAAGNLLHFLQNLKKQTKERGEEEFKRMAVRIAREVAAGMHHLHSEDLVHRDLAARNILLTRDHSVKVSDFGLSTLESDEERAESIPVRWTPPEYFSRRTFDKKSDVWSYGVLLWEIVNFGQTPYPGLSNEQVVAAVLDGEVLTFSENAPQVLQTIAAQCFQHEPAERPSFKDIIKLLKADEYSK